MQAMGAQKVWQSEIHGKLVEDEHFSMTGAIVL